MDEQLITKTRPATSVKGLTPGTTYTLQVRSFNDDSGFSDWSDPITRIWTWSVSRMGIESRTWILNSHPKTTNLSAPIPPLCIPG